MGYQPIKNNRITNQNLGIHPLAAMMGWELLDAVRQYWLLSVTLQLNIAMENCHVPGEIVHKWAMASIAMLDYQRVYYII